MITYDTAFHIFWIIVGVILGKMLYEYIKKRIEDPMTWSCPVCKTKGVHTRFKSNRHYVLDLLMKDHLNWHRENGDSHEDRTD